MKGKFVVLEGPDGSGQTTQAELLKHFLTKKGKSVVLTKEPTKESEAGRKLSDVLNHRLKLTPHEVQELFNEDRREHIKNLIIPSLNEGRFVISDRYFFSSMAYGPEDYDFEFVQRDFPIPDLTFILKVSPEECIRRIEFRGRPVQFYETQRKLKKVMANYEKIPEKFPNIYLINGEASIEEVHKEILDKVKNILE